MTQISPARVGKMIRPQPGCRLLFTFDTLMIPKTIRERALDPVFVTTAVFESRRFIVYMDGRPSMSPARGHVVHGVVWEISDLSMACLGLHLGVPEVYDRYGGLDAIQPGP